MMTLFPGCPRVGTHSEQPWSQSRFCIHSNAILGRCPNITSYFRNKAYFYLKISHSQWSHNYQAIQAQLNSVHGMEKRGPLCAGQVLLSFSTGAGGGSQGLPALGKHSATKPHPPKSTKSTPSFTVRANPYAPRGISILV